MAKSKPGKKRTEEVSEPQNVHDALVPEVAPPDWVKVMNGDPGAVEQAIASGHVEQGDFNEEDFEASDRAWANIAAQEKDRAARRATGEEVDDDEDDMIFPHEEGYDPSEAPSLKDMFGDVPGF